MSRRPHLEHDEGPRPAVGRSERVVSELRFTPADLQQQARGLLGFVQLVVAGLLRVDCALRRTRDGRVVLSFPVKHDSAGRQHPLVAPANAEARRALEVAVLDALAIDLRAARTAPTAQGQTS